MNFPALKQDFVATHGLRYIGATAVLQTAVRACLSRSVWGLFTASAVAMPASAPPGMKRDVARQPSDAPSKMNGTSHHGVIGPIPLRAASTARVLNGVARPGLVGKAVGDGLKLATKVNGALAYREDSFDLGDSRYGMTREWVSEGGREWVDESVS